MKIASVVIALIALVATSLLLVGYESIKSKAAKLEEQMVNQRQQIFGSSLFGVGKGGRMGTIL